MSEKRKFKNWRDLAQLDYFNLLDDGRLELNVPGLDGIIDFHTHIGWNILIAPPVNILKETPDTLHNFEADLSVNLDIYSGQNLFETRPKWGMEDYLKCAFSPLKRGKHLTHTIPNLIKEMDALKIEQSIVLSLDIINSYNSRRFGEALRFNPRLVFFCMVHPLHRKMGELIDEYLHLGAKGMKLHPELQMMAVDNPKLIKMIKLWQKKSGGMPVLAHSGFNGFEPKAAKEKADIRHYWALAEALEGSPCILGHSAMNYYRDAIAIAEKHPHVLLELSGQPPAHIKEMIARLGPDRLLFGSDWPIYPQSLPLAKVLIATEDDPEARLKILRDNARRILGEH